MCSGPLVFKWQSDIKTKQIRSRIDLWVWFGDFVFYWPGSQRMKPWNSIPRYLPIKSCVSNLVLILPSQCVVSVHTCLPGVLLIQSLWNESRVSSLAANSQCCSFCWFLNHTVSSEGLGKLSTN